MGLTRYFWDSYAVIEVVKGNINYVNNLKPKFRDVIRMFYWNDMKHREIGERLGIPETTVKWRLISAKEKLKLSLLNSPIGEYVGDLKKAA